MATPVFNTGYLGTFAFGATTGGTEFPTRSWRARNGTEADRAKNSLSGLYPIPLCTYASFITTVMFDVDFANPRFSTATYPIAIQQQLTDLNFYQSRSARGSLGTITTPSAATIQGWTASNGVVMDIDNGVEVRGTAVQMYTMIVECYGTITTPF